MACSTASMSASEAAHTERHGRPAPGRHHAHGAWTARAGDAGPLVLQCLVPLRSVVQEAFPMTSTNRLEVRAPGAARQVNDELQVTNE